MTEIREKTKLHSREQQIPKHQIPEQQIPNHQVQEQILHACPADLDRILEIYDIAKKYMHENGNPNQWNGAYPDRATLETDIACNRLYIYKSDGVIHGVFVLLLEKEATYDYIEEGQWLNDMPYGTIHRIAGSREIKGIFEKCLHFCKQKLVSMGRCNLRIDTHHDNHTMQYLLEKHGFVKCGIIYLINGEPRIAYQHTIVC